MDSKTKQEVIEKFELLDNVSKDEQAYWNAFYNAFEVVFRNIEDIDFKSIYERQDFKFFLAVTNMSKRADAIFSNSDDEEPSLFKKEPPPYTPTNADMRRHLKAFIAGYDEKSLFANCALELLIDLIMRKNVHVVDEKGTWDCEGIRTRLATVITQTKYPIIKTMIDPAAGGLGKTWEQTQSYLFTHRELSERIANEHQKKAIFDWVAKLGKDNKNRHEIPRIIAVLCKKWFKEKGDLQKKTRLFTYPLKHFFLDLTTKDLTSPESELTPEERTQKERIYEALRIIRYVQYPNGKNLAPFLFTSFGRDEKTGEQYLNVDFSPFELKFGYLISPVETIYAITSGQTDEYQSFAGLLALHIAFRQGNKGYPVNFTYRELASQTKFTERFIKANIEDVLTDLKTSKVILNYEKFEAAGKATRFKLTPCKNTHSILKAENT